ncbi:MAG: hypothetical protein ACRC6M_18030, partial [Microcystaceae cyanobacterium]
MSDKNMEPNYTALIEKLLSGARLLGSWEISKEEELISALKVSEQVKLAIFMLHWYQQNFEAENSYPYWLITNILFRLLKRPLPFTLNEILEILNTLQSDVFLMSIGMNKLPFLVQNYLKENPPSPELQIEIEKICQ